MGLIDMWRIGIIEKIWPHMYCFIDINLFSCLRVLVADSSKLIAGLNGKLFVCQRIVREKSEWSFA